MGVTLLFACPASPLPRPLLEDGRHVLEPFKLIEGGGSSKLHVAAGVVALSCMPPDNSTSTTREDACSRSELSAWTDELPLTEV